MMVRTSQSPIAKRIMLGLVVFLVVYVIKAQSLSEGWSVNVGGSQDEVAGFFMDAKSVIDLDADGNLYYATSTKSTDGTIDSSEVKGNYDIFLAKFDSDGNKLWSKNYGGDLNDIPRKIMCLDGGDILLAGHTRSNSGDLTGHHGGNDSLPDGFITRFDSAGNVVWKRQYGGAVFLGSAGTGSDYLYSFVINSKGNIVAVGETNSQDGDLPPDWLSSDPSFQVGWFLEVNIETGGVIRSKRLKSPYHDEWNANRTEDIVELSDGSGYAVLGNQAYILSDFFWISKVDSTGEIVWEKEYGGNGSFTYIASIVETYDGNIMFTGSVGPASNDINPSLHNGGVSEMWVVKLQSSDGIMMDQFCFGGSNSDIPYKILSDGTGKYYLCGNSNSTDGYMPSPDLFTDAYITYFTEQFDTVWTHKFGGSAYDAATDIALGAGTDIYIAGASSSSDYYFEGRGYGGVDGWVGKFSNPTTGITDKRSLNDQLSVFPNPSQGLVTIKANLHSNEKTTVRMYNSIGTLVLSKNVSVHYVLNESLDLESYENGIYYIEVQSGNRALRQKLVLNR